jgi:hypothetical protein
MNPTEQKARALLAQLSPEQRLRLAVEILQDDWEAETVDLPAWPIQSSTERLARYQLNPHTGVDA